MIYNFISGAFYINLDRRLDRRELFEKRIKEINLQVERISATEFKKEDVKDVNVKNWHAKISCTHSHFKAIKEAKDRGWSNVLIFEDDCIFSEDFNINIQNCLNDLKNIDWNLFYLGGEPNDYCDPITNNVSKVKSGIYGTHAYIINSNFFDKVLKIPYDFGIIDQIYIGINNRSYIISKKLLAWQDDNCYSDIWEQKFKESYLIYKEAYKKWML